MLKNNSKSLVPTEFIERNKKRFPKDFMFQLSIKETEDLISSRSRFVTLNLRSQIATLSLDYGGRRYLPYVFTEQGVAMLSSVLNSNKAIEVNIAIMRVFVRIRQLMLSHKDIARRLDDLEKKYDHQFSAVFDAIRQLITEKEKPKNKIGFAPQK